MLSVVNIASGIAGGAVSGAIAGAAVDITIATGGTAGAVIISAMVGGAIGNATGDAVNQVGNNIAKGQSLTKAIKNVSVQSVLINAGIGAASGALGGATSNVLDAFNTGTKKIFSQIASNALKSGDKEVIEKSITSVYKVSVQTANGVAIIDYSTNIVYNAASNTLSYYVNNQLVQTISIIVTNSPSSSGNK